MKYEFKIKQDGVWVVKGFADSITDATNEVAHYLMMYEQDGPIDSVVIKKKRRIAMIKNKL